MNHQTKKIGVMVAMPQELKALCDERKTYAEIGSKLYWKAKISHQDVIIACCGLGKINATQVACTLLQKFQCRSILMCGVAGGIDLSLQIGDVVIANHVICHDYGVIENQKLIACPPNTIPQNHHHQSIALQIDDDLQQKIYLPSLTTNLNETLQTPAQVILGTVLSGDTFLNCHQTRNSLFQKYHAQAIDMESIAVAQTCQAFQKRWLIVRSLSDFAEEANVQNLKQASNNAAQIARQLIHFL